MTTADELLTSIESKQAQAAELRRKLAGSLRLQDYLGADCFAHGTIKVGGRSTQGDPHLGTVTFTLGNGEVIERPAMDVPFSLWPYGLQDAFKRMDAWKRKRIEKKLGIEL